MIENAGTKFCSRSLIDPSLPSYYLPVLYFPYGRQTDGTVPVHTGVPGTGAVRIPYIHNTWYRTDRLPERIVLTFLNL